MSLEQSSIILFSASHVSQLTRATWIDDDDDVHFHLPVTQNALLMLLLRKRLRNVNIEELRTGANKISWSGTKNGQVENS